MHEQITLAVLYSITSFSSELGQLTQRQRDNALEFIVRLLQQPDSYITYAGMPHPVFVITKCGTKLSIGPQVGGSGNSALYSATTNTIQLPYAALGGNDFDLPAMVLAHEFHHALQACLGASFHKATLEKIRLTLHLMKLMGKEFKELEGIEAFVRGFPFKLDKRSAEDFATMIESGKNKLRNFIRLQKRLKIGKRLKNKEKRLVDRLRPLIKEHSLKPYRQDYVDISRESKDFIKEVRDSIARRGYFKMPLEGGFPPRYITAIHHTTAIRHSGDTLHYQFFSHPPRRYAQNILALLDDAFRIYTENLASASEAFQIYAVILKINYQDLRDWYILTEQDAFVMQLGQPLVKEFFPRMLDYAQRKFIDHCNATKLALTAATVESGGSALLTDFKHDLSEQVVTALTPALSTVNLPIPVFSAVICGIMLATLHKTAKRISHKQYNEKNTGTLLYLLCVFIFQILFCDPTTVVQNCIFMLGIFLLQRQLQRAAFFMGKNNQPSIATALRELGTFLDAAYCVRNPSQGPTWEAGVEAFAGYCAH